MLLGQNSVAETKIFTKLLPYKRSDLSLRRVVATCCCNLSPSVFKEGGKTRKLLADAGKPYGRMELGEGDARFLCVCTDREEVNQVGMDDFPLMYY